MINPYFEGIIVEKLREEEHESMKKQYAISDELTSEDIKVIRRKLGFTQKELAQFVHVSVKTIERWESEKKSITGPIVPLVKILNENPRLEQDLRVPEKKELLRIWYMCKSDVCTIIDVNERLRYIRIYNYTNDLLKRAFGRIENPTFEQYEEFLESRCFPWSRDKMKLMLKELNIPFYEPLMIIEKTQGRMAEDDFWIRIER